MIEQPGQELAVMVHCELLVIIQQWRDLCWGLQAIYPGPNLSKRVQQEAVYP